jgi:uncharacterized protein HemX
MKQYLTNQWSSFTPAIKMGVGVAALIVFLILAYSFYSGLESFIDYRADKKTARERAETKLQIEAKQAEIEQHKATADEWQRQAEQKDEEIAKYKVAVEALGKQGDAVLKKVEDENAKLEKEFSAISVDLDACSRYKRLCERLKLAGCTCQ